MIIGPPGIGFMRTAVKSGHEQLTAPKAAFCPARDTNSLTVGTSRHRRPDAIATPHRRPRSADSLL